MVAAAIGEKRNNSTTTFTLRVQRPTLSTIAQGVSARTVMVSNLMMSGNVHRKMTTSTTTFTKTKGTSGVRTIRITREVISTRLAHSLGESSVSTGKRLSFDRAAQWVQRGPLGTSDLPELS
jgi:hypothetical protein